MGISTSYSFTPAGQPAQYYANLVSGSRRICRTKLLILILAITFVSELAKHFPGSRTFKREDIEALIKSGNLNREIAAAKDYGFITKIKDSFQITDLFKTHNNALSEKEKRKCLLTAFGSASLYAEIITKYDGHAIPKEFKVHLIRFHKIAENAAQFAADVFIENGKYVGAINESNLLNYKDELAKNSDPSVEYAEIITERRNGDATANDQTDNAQITFSAKQQQAIMIPENRPVEQRVQVPLTGGKTAYIVYPSTLTERDAEILKKQVELLALLAV